MTKELMVEKDGRLVPLPLWGLITFSYYDQQLKEDLIDLLPKYEQDKVTAIYSIITDKAYD